MLNILVSDLLKSIFFDKRIRVPYIRLPRHELVRQISCFGSRISSVLISPTTGEWAVTTDGVIHSLGMRRIGTIQFLVRLYTLNGSLAAESYTSVPSRALAFTTRMEGRYVNVLATASHSTLL